MQRGLLPIRDAARELGLREKTLRRWITLRKIEYVKVGDRAVRIPSDEIARFIDSGRVPRIPKGDPNLPPDSTRRDGGRTSA